MDMRIEPASLRRDVRNLGAQFALGQLNMQRLADMGPAGVRQHCTIGLAFGAADDGVATVEHLLWIQMGQVRRETGE